MKIAFFETKAWEEKYLAEQLAAHELSFFPAAVNSETLVGLQEVEVLSVFADSKVDSSVLEKLPKLKLIATRTTGTDHIDLASAQARGIKVANVAFYGENTVAEFAFALLLTLARKVHLAIDKVKERGQFDSDGLTGFDLAGKTIGVVGSGHIGQSVIKIANGFGMKVLAFDSLPKPELESALSFKYVTFEELLAASDVITLHIPYLPSTHHLINLQNIGKIKKGAVLVNTARGAIVETQAIVKALNEGILSAAALDVLEEEAMLKKERNLVGESDLDDQDLRTIWQNHILIGMDNVIITPHNAFNTREALQRILETTVKNILSG